MKENTKNSIINGLKDNVANNLVKIPTEIADQAADYLKTKSPSHLYRDGLLINIKV